MHEMGALHGGAVSIVASVPYIHATKWMARLSRYKWKATFFVDPEELGAKNQWETLVHMGHDLGILWKGDSIPNDPQIEAAALMLRELRSTEPYCIKLQEASDALSHFATDFGSIQLGTINEDELISRDKGSLRFMSPELPIAFESLKITSFSKSVATDLLQRAQDESQWVVLELTEDGWTAWSEALYDVGLPVLSLATVVGRLTKK